MIKNINDIQLFLKILDDFHDSKGISHDNLLSLIQEKIRLTQWNFELEDILQLGISLNLFHQKNDYISLSQKGLDVIELNDGNFDLNELQLEFISENCFFNNPNFSKLFNFLKLFKFDKKQKTLVLNPKYYPIPRKLSTELLTQLNIVNIDSSLWKINPKYIQFIEIIDHKKKSITQNQIDKLLEEQKRIGFLAEELTIKYEKERLEKKKLFQESKNVQQISQIYANRGYDIESFSKKTTSLKPDLFIEVKGRKHRLMSFIISANELLVAKQLGSQYAIYFWNNLGSNIIPSAPIKIIKDPFKTLNIQECDNCLNYLVSLEDLVT